MARSLSFLTPDGLWLADYTSDPAWREDGKGGSGARSRAALFLDRDGCLIEERHYLADPEGVALLPGAAAVVVRANALGLAVVVVTNQSGVGRGLIDWTQLAAVEASVTEQLLRQGARLDLTLACPFHAKARPPWRHPDHPARKPRPGMLLEAARRLGLDLRTSWIVGDKADDLAAGRAAGLAGGLQVRTGHGGETEEGARAEALARPGFAVRRAPGIAAALDLPILGGA